MTVRRVMLVALLVAWGPACTGPAVEVDAAPAPWTSAELRQLSELRQVTTLQPEPTNAFSDNPAAAALGKALFYDPGLSPSGVSCATCHRPELHFTDGLPLGKGVGTTKRHTPSVMGSQRGPWFAWDGRADSLWAQALGPLEDPNEMGSDRVFAVRRASTQHAELWRAAFGEVPDLSDLQRFPRHGRPVPGDPDGEVARAWQGMAAEDRAMVDAQLVKLVKAIGAFERLVLPGEAPFDRYVDATLAGEAVEDPAWSDAAEDGLRLFLRDGNCVSCHLGPMFSDRAFHNLGLPESRGRDVGRTDGAFKVAASVYNCAGPHSDTSACAELDFLNPTFDDFRGAFKTPSLRNVAETAPYMHNGDFASLEDVLAFYSELPGEPLFGHRELTLQPLELSDEDISDVIAFLKTLTAPVPAALFPGPTQPGAQPTP